MEVGTCVCVMPSAVRCASEQFPTSLLVKY